MLPDAFYELPEPALFVAIMIATGAVAAVIHLIFRSPRLAPPVLADLSPVLQTLCGTLFVLSVTFLANNVWQTEARAKETVNAEARSLRLVRTYVDELPETGRAGLEKRLADYTAAVAQEWPEMEEAGGSPAAENRLAEVFDFAIGSLADGDTGKLLQPRILAGLDAMAQARENRISVAMTDHVTGGQWFSVVGLAVLLFTVISICHAKAAKARAVALGIMTVAISLAFFVIMAHDRPFIGFQAIGPDAILAAAQ